MKIFSRNRCKLGESPLWHPIRNSLLWIDIIEQKIFEKNLFSKNSDYDNAWDIDLIISALARKIDSSHEIWLVTNKGLALLDLETGQYIIKVKLDLPKNFRTNDAHVGPDGAFWIGTMQKLPTRTLGSLYRITQNFQVEKIIHESIGIPNTICWSLNNSKLYLSDSLLQKMFVFEFPIDPNNIKKHLFIDLSQGKATPDGGAVDTLGGLWNAQWDGYAVVHYNSSGIEISRLSLPVPRPTSCCFGGEQNQTLFVTSASEGLNEKALAKYPKSGNVFMFELKGSMGSVIYNF